MFASLLLLSAIELLPVPCAKGGHEPQLSVGADGHVALAWGTPDVLFCCVGAVDAQGFQSVREVARGLRFAVGMRRGPRVALLPGDQVVISAIGGVEGGGKDGDLLVWHGTSKKPVRVNSEPGTAREGLHALARGPSGELYCAWIDLRAKSPQLFGALSTDGGQTWRLEKALSKGTELCPCCAPSAAFDAQGNVSVMWRGARNGSRDMQLVRSIDGGQSFSEPAQLGTGAWQIDFCPMDGGALAPDAEGKLVSAWRRDTNVYLAKDGKDERLIGSGEQPWIAAGSVVWLEKRGAKLLWLAPGAKDPETLAESANDPVIAAQPDGKGPLYAAWETGAGDASEIKLARLAPR
jgi:hypothetical protein